MLPQEQAWDGVLDHACIRVLGHCLRAALDHHSRFQARCNLWPVLWASHRIANTARSPQSVDHHLQHHSQLGNLHHNIHLNNLPPLPIKLLRVESPSPCHLPKRPHRLMRRLLPRDMYLSSLKRFPAKNPRQLSLAAASAASRVQKMPLQLYTILVHYLQADINLYKHLWA